MQTVKENVLMTNRRRFFLNGLLLTAVGLAIRSVSLAFNSFITYSIGAEGIGLFTLIGTVYSFAITFATSGISLTVTRLVSSAIGEGKEKNVNHILRSAVLYSLIFSIFAACVLFFGAEYFAGRVLSDERTLEPLRILSLSLVPIALSSVFTGYFTGVKRVARNAVVQVIGQIFKIVITVVFLLSYAGLGVEEGIIALSASMTLTEISIFIVAFIQFILDSKRYGKGKLGEEHFSSVTKMALPLATSAYIRSALLSVEHILIPKRLRDSGKNHSESLSLYGTLHGMALPVLLYPMATLTSFAGLLVPEFSESQAKGEKERMNRISSEALNTTLVYAVSAMAFVYLFSEELGYVVYDSYDAGYYIALMAPVIPIMYLDHVADSMLKGIGEHVYSMWVNISDSFLSVLLVWFLIPKMGIAGYALVIVVMEGYNFLLSIVRLKKRINFKISFVKSLFIPLLNAYISALVSKALFLNCGKFTPPVWLFLEILFSICIYVALYMLSMLLIGKAFKKQENKN